MSKIILILAAIIAMSACDNENERQLKTAAETFTANMFTEIVHANPGESVVLSAFSVLTPLAQLSLATEGASHEELLKAIGTKNDNATREVFPIIDKELSTTQGIELKIASRIYVSTSAVLNPTFQNEVITVFNSDVAQVDFNDGAAAAKEINKWVEDQTNNKIKDLVSAASFNSDTVCILTDAIYFKGLWQTQFKKENTKPRDFHVSSTETKEIATMYVKDDFRYGESEELDAKLLELPYNGSQASMLIILPNQIDGLVELEKKLEDPAAISKATSEMFKTEVEVYLPKFTIETKTDLKEVLQNIGVGSIFEPQSAQITHLIKGDTNIYVSAAVQKAFIEVSEEGTEAAAANENAVTTFSLHVFVKFNADRPFYYQILAENIVLFSGVFVS